MFIIGKANSDEIREMEKMGFKVELVDYCHFNHALDPEYDSTKDPELQMGIEGDDVLVAVFIDCDIAEECRIINKGEVFP